MDTKDTAEKTAPSLAPAMPAPASKPAGEPQPEVPVPPVPLSGRGDDSLEGLGAAFSGLSVGGPEGKEKEKEKEVKHLGGGQPPSFPWHARPQSHEIQDLNSNLGFSKEFCDPCLGHDTIWRPGQEMKVSVDNKNM